MSDKEKSYSKNYVNRLRAQIRNLDSTIAKIKSNQKEDSPKDNNSWSQKHRLDYFNSFITFILAIGTIIVAIYAVSQTEISENAAMSAKKSAKASERSIQLVEESLGIGKQSLEIQRESIKISNRPYLVIDDIKLKELIINGKRANFIVGKKFVVTLTIRNKGQTPAYEVIDFLRIDILEPDANLPMPPPNKSSQYIVGNDIRRFKQSERVFKEEDSIKINNDKSWLYFWGKVKYVDVTGIPYYVEFGYRYIFTHKDWFPYKEYNRAN